MDEKLINNWVEEVWQERPGGLRKVRAFLVWDMFRAHLCESVKDDIKKNNTRQAVIPGGCTSLLQPLDVCSNKPFKGSMREKWNNEWRKDIYEGWCYEKGWI